jgi:hypothetical protein
MQRNRAWAVDLDRPAGRMPQRPQPVCTLLWISTGRLAACPRILAALCTQPWTLAARPQVQATSCETPWIRPAANMTDRGIAPARRSCSRRGVTD